MKLSVRFKQNLDWFLKQKIPREFDRKVFSKELRSLIIAVTWRCNSRCITCHLWKTPSSVEKQEMSVKEIKKMINSKYFKHVRLIRFTGGEPTLRKDFLDIIKVVHRALPNAVIRFSTNCTQQKNLEKIMRFVKNKKIPHLIAFPLNGREKIHDFSRGVKGSYQLTIQTIKKCIELGIRFSIDFTLYPFNYGELIPVYNMAEKLKTQFGLGIGRPGKRYLLTCFKRFQWKRENMEKAARELRKLIKLNPIYIPHYIVFVQAMKSSKLFDCYNLLKDLAIDPYGNVYSCDKFSEMLKLGNLREYQLDFNKLVEENQEHIRNIWKIIRERKCQPCGVFCELVRHKYRQLPLGTKMYINLYRVKEYVRRFPKI
ncbi:MAG: radical SAM protein [Candidatus Aenigmarchaeota archaeon]|nr:radical SAM protein [Candidatus Aenigmarchaeota archaeon]